MPRADRKVQLIVCCLPMKIRRYPMKAFVSLSIRLYGSFFGAIVNIALLMVVAGILLVASFTRGSLTLFFGVSLQLLLLPTLMAFEEFLHLWVCIQKGLPQKAIDLVAAFRMTAGGRRLICYGCAVRYRGFLTPLDRIHISAPGPIFCLLLALALWSLVFLDSGSYMGNLLQHRFLPLILYLLSSLWPYSVVLPTDLANIIRAKREGRYSVMRTLGACFESLRLIWSSSLSIIEKEES